MAELIGFAVVAVLGYVAGRVWRTGEINQIVRERDGYACQLGRERRANSELMEFKTKYMALKRMEPVKVRVHGSTVTVLHPELMGDYDWKNGA